jgi:hypothetical protein
MLEDDQQDATDYILIDLTEAVFRRRSSEHWWELLRKRDQSNLREMFSNARAAKVRPNG